MEKIVRKKREKKIKKRFVTGGIRTLNPLLQSQESYPLDQGAKAKEWNV